MSTTREEFKAASDHRHAGESIDLLLPDHRRLRIECGYMLGGTSIGVGPPRPKTVREVNVRMDDDVFATFRVELVPARDA